MDKLFLFLINNSISVSWLILAAIAVRPLLRKLPKWASCLIWGIVGLRLVLPVRLKSALSLIPSASTLPPDILTDPMPAIQSGIPAVDAAVNPSFTTTTTVIGLSRNPLQVWSMIGEWIWLLGFCAMMIYMIITSLRLLHQVKVSIHLGGKVYICDDIDTPFILGLLRPRICIPSSLQGQDLLHVLAHERAHIHRKDHWWKPIGFLILSVYWFHPLVWAAYILLCRDIELACDERVIRQLGAAERKAYSAALLRCSTRPKAVAACPLAFGEIGVKTRIRSVLHYKKPGFWLVLLAIILCIAAAVGFLTDPKDPAEPVERLDGRVLETEENRILVMPFDNPEGRIWVTIPEDADPVREGNHVRISYIGGILELFPSEIRSTTRIELLPKAGAESYSHMTVDGYVCVAIDIPAGWECEALKTSAQIGYYFRPAGKPGGIKLYHTHPDNSIYDQNLEFGEIRLPSGWTMYPGYEKGSSVWSMATFDAPGCYVAELVDADQWWSEYEEQAMQIIGNAALSANVISAQEAIAVARTAVNGKYRFPIAGFDSEAGVWRISFFRRLEDSAAAQIILVSADGELLDAEDWGLTITATNITASGLRLICSPSETPHPGELFTGSHYWLEQKTQNGWTEIKPIAEAYFTTEAFVLHENRETAFDISWAHLYGTLTPGEYRIGKQITFRPLNQRMIEAKSRSYYAVFSIT